MLWDVARGGIIKTQSGEVFISCIAADSASVVGGGVGWSGTGSVSIFTGLVRQHGDYLGWCRVMGPIRVTIVILLRRELVEAGKKSTRGQKSSSRGREGHDSCSPNAWVDILEVNGLGAVRLVVATLIPEVRPEGRSVRVVMGVWSIEPRVKVWEGLGGAVNLCLLEYFLWVIQVRHQLVHVHPAAPPPSTCSTSVHLLHLHPPAPLRPPAPPPSTCSTSVHLLYLRPKSPMRPGLHPRTCALPHCSIYCISYIPYMYNKPEY